MTEALQQGERERDVGRSIFGALVCVCVLLCWSHTPYNLLLGSFFVLLFVTLFQCLWAQKTILLHCADTRTPSENETHSLFSTFVSVWYFPVNLDPNLSGFLLFLFF